MASPTSFHTQEVQAALAREFGVSIEVRDAPSATPFDVVLLAAPRSEAAAYELVKWCGSKGQALVPTGGGTRLHIGTPPTRPVLLLSTEHLTQVLDWDEGNATVEAQGGITLCNLNAHVAHGRQFVPLDDARNGSLSTLGGAVAANAYGSAKLKWGVPRDLVVGLHAGLSDGRIVKAGAKVVKNVAGYDLPKLFTGSWGTLGVLTRVTLRLRAQEASRMRWECEVKNWQEASVLSSNLLSSGFEPTWVCITANKSGLRLAVCFDGGEAALHAQRERLPRAGQAGNLTEGEPASGIAPQLEAPHWELRSGLPLARSGAWAELCAEFGASQVVWDVGTGTVYAAWEALELAAVRQLRVAAQTAGGFVVVERAPTERQTSELVWGNPPTSFALMRGLKAKFDPQGICAPGRFVGGL